MLNFIGSIFTFVMDMAGMALDLAFGALGLVFDLLGGLFSLILGMGALGIFVALIFVVRRSSRKRSAGHPYEENGAAPQKVYDVDGEEFVSFYDQFREQK